jgi:hypothetical protein
VKRVVGLLVAGGLIEVDDGECRPMLQSGLGQACRRFDHERRPGDGEDVTALGQGPESKQGVFRKRLTEKRSVRFDRNATVPASWREVTVFGTRPHRLEGSSSATSRTHDAIQGAVELNNVYRTSGLVEPVGVLCNDRAKMALSFERGEGSVGRIRLVSAGKRLVVHVEKALPEHSRVALEGTAVELLRIILRPDPALASEVWNTGGRADGGLGEGNRLVRVAEFGGQLLNPVCHAVEWGQRVIKTGRHHANAQAIARPRSELGNNGGVARAACLAG